MRVSPLAAFTSALAVFAAAPLGAKTWDLPASPQTVAWGHYDATSKPVLTVKSGDTVTVHTLLTNSPAGLAKAGVAEADIEPALKAVFEPLNRDNDFGDERIAGSLERGDLQVFL